MFLISCPGCTAVEWYSPISCSSWGHESACWWRTFRLGPGMEHCMQNFLIYNSHSITWSARENPCWSPRQSSPTPLTSAFQHFFFFIEISAIYFSLWIHFPTFCKILKRQIKEKGMSSRWWKCWINSWDSASALWRLCLAFQVLY